MKKIMKCPDCDKQLNNNVSRCNCGWENNLVRGVTDFRCHIQVEGKRCPLIGTMTRSKFANAVWYCSYHYDDCEDPIKTKKILDFVIENYQKIISGQMNKYLKFHVEHELLQDK